MWPHVGVLWSFLIGIVPAAAFAADDRPESAIRVVDYHSGAPVAGARVALPPRDLVVAVGDDGTLPLAGLLAAGEPSPACRLRVSAPGYAEVIVSCGVVAAAGVHDVALVAQPLRLRETVVVAASRDERPADIVPRAVSVLTTEDLARALPRTTPEALFDTVGVWVQKTNHGGGSPIVRGLTGNQVLVLVDGIRLNNSTFRYGPNQYMATIDPTSLERIEVVRGAGSVLFGSDALGGVVNLVTRAPELSPGTPRLDGRVVGRAMSGGMEQSLRAEMSASGGRAAARGGLSLRRYGDLRAGGSLGIEEPSGYHEINGDARVLAQLGPRTVLAAAWQHVHQDDVPRFDQVAQRGYARWSFDPQVRQLAWARVSHATGRWWAHTLSLTPSWQRSFERRERQRVASPLLTVEEDTVDTLGVLGEGRGSLGRDVSLRYGVDVYRDRVSSGREDRDLGTGSAVSRRGLYPDGARATSAEIFASATWRRGRATIDGGARQTWTSLTARDATFGDLGLDTSATIGSLAAGFELGREWAVYGVVAQAFRAPNIDDVSTLGAFDFGVEVPSTDLVPEQSVSVEGGAKLQRRRVQMTASLWRISLNDLIDRVRATFEGSDTWEGQRVYRRANVGAAFVRGAEIDLRTQIAAGLEATGFVAYAYGQQVTTGQPMRRIPPLNGRVALQWHGRRPTLEAAVRVAGRQDRLAPGDRDDHRINPLGTPGWTVVDLRGSLAVSPRVTIVGGVGNLFDEAYRVHGSGVDGYGRHVWIGVDVGGRRP